MKTRAVFIVETGTLNVSDEDGFKCFTRKYGPCGRVFKTDFEKAKQSVKDFISSNGEFSYGIVSNAAISCKITDCELDSIIPGPHPVKPDGRMDMSCIVYSSANIKGLVIDDFADQSYLA